jgi:hypothetical protein
MAADRRTLVTGGAIGTLLAAAVLGLALALLIQPQPRGETAGAPRPAGRSAERDAGGDVAFALAGARPEQRARVLLSRDAGEPLRVEAESARWEILGFEAPGRDDLATSRRLARRYGAFSLYVVRDRRSLDRLVRGRRGSGGLLWRRTLSSTGSKRLVTWTAVKRYGRAGLVVLSWQAGGRPATDARFGRLDRVLRRL